MVLCCLVFGVCCSLIVDCFFFVFVFCVLFDIRSLLFVIYRLLFLLIVVCCFWFVARVFVRCCL